MYIEDEVEELRKDVDNLSGVIDFLARHILTNPADHSDVCISYAKDSIKKYGYSGGCTCQSDFINKYLCLERVPVLDTKEAKDLRKEYLRIQRENRKKRAKKK